MNYENGEIVIQQLDFFNSLSMQNLFAEDNSDIHAELFRGFMRRFNKTYVSDEELQKRYNIFQHNLKYIRHIQDQEKGTARYGPTIFADLTRKCQ